MSLGFLSSVPEIRCCPANQAAPRPDGEFVLYWMTSARRPTYNFALQRAAEWAQHLQKPLLILEALRRDYPWVCPRFHEFVMAGMADHQDHFATRPVTYYAYLEDQVGQGKGLLESLGQRACLVVGDEFPCFFLPRMQKALAPRLKILFELVDSNGLLPLRAAPKAYERAVDFRRFLQKNLAAHLVHTPKPDPLLDLQLPRLAEPLPEWQRWPHSVRLETSAWSGPAHVSGEPGGFRAAQSALQAFWKNGLARYHQRSEPSLKVSTRMSAYFHFGQASPHQVLHELAQAENWTPDRLTYRPTGTKDGSWGMSPNAEGFLDELVTWRELCYNTSFLRDDYDRYESLPAWARATLESHLEDKRPHLYSLEQLEQAQSHDRVWNAAQRQLIEEGRIHNYLRMVWGKKILEWSEHPRQAVETMIELNNKYALDGRNPNSYGGIFWCLGRYDRPWFERAIFGTIRYMSSDSTAKKFKLDTYLARYDKQGSLF